ERLSEPRQRGQGPRHAHLLAGRAQIQADAPGEPLRAGAKTVVPAAQDIELANQVQQASSRGIEMHGQLGDLVTQALQRAENYREPPSMGRLYTGVSRPPGRCVSVRLRPLRAFSRCGSR